MIARVWQGDVPIDKADGYAAYLCGSDRGVKDYQRVPGNRGALLLRVPHADRVRFVLLSLWESREAIARYAGPDIEQARYFSFDRECLIDPEPTVTHYEVLAAPDALRPSRGFTWYRL